MQSVCEPRRYGFATTDWLVKPDHAAIRKARRRFVRRAAPSDAHSITADRLPAEVGGAGPARTHVVQRELAEPAMATEESLKMAEAELIRRALARHGGNLTQAAAQLGIAKSTLYEKIRRHDLLAAVSDVRRRVTRGSSDL